MAKKEIKTKAPAQPKKAKTWHSEKHIMLGPANYIMFGLGILCIVLGFILMSMGSMNIAPLLLVLGFSFLIPISIMLGIGHGGTEEERLKAMGTKED